MDPDPVSTGTPNSTPNSTLVMSASSESSTWEAVEEVTLASSSRNRPYESCAASCPRINRGRKRGSPCAGEPGSWEESELPFHGQLCTPTRDQPRQCGTPQLAGSREVHDKHRRGRQLLKGAFLLPRMVSSFRDRQLLYRRRRLIPRSRFRIREFSRLRLRPRHLRRRQRCRHCRTLGKSTGAHTTHFLSTTTRFRRREPGTDRSQRVLSQLVPRCRSGKMRRQRERKSRPVALRILCHRRSHGPSMS